MEEFDPQPKSPFKKKKIIKSAVKTESESTPTLKRRSQQKPFGQKPVHEVSQRKYPKTFDPQVDILVRILNRVLGVYTISSCEGHKEGDNTCAEWGTFYINMKIDNANFAGFLQDIFNDGGGIFFEYNSKYNTWKLAGDNSALPALEGWGLEWGAEFGMKPIEEWCIFYNADQTGIKK
jgi:hypothetical protein